MTLKYYGTIETLKVSVASTKIPGEWQFDGSKQSFRSRAGGILNWWPSSGTVQFQGKDPGKSQLQHALHDYLADASGIGYAEQPAFDSACISAGVNTERCLEPPVMRPQGQDSANSSKIDLTCLLMDLAAVLAKQQLVLVMIDGVPRIVQEHAYGHYATTSLEDKPPMHIRRY